MIKVLLLIDELEGRGAATQMRLLAGSLPRERFQLRVLVLGKDRPHLRKLRAAGLTVQALGWTRPLDLRGAWELRQLIQDDRPDVIHVARPAALAKLAVALDQIRGAVIVGAPLDGSERGALDAPARLLLGRADRVIARGPGEARQVGRLGLPAHAVQIVPPAVAIDQFDSDNARSVLRIVCAGRLEAHKGFHDAIWAYDILRRVCPRLELQILGEGNESSKLRQFVAALGNSSVVQLPGWCDDVARALANADIVWLPSRTHYSGMNVALEAMAAGRPVVAARRDGLDEVVVDGVTGFLAQAGDKVGFARATRLLIDDSALRRRLGAAGQERARQHFSTTAFAERMASIYEELAA